MSLSTESASEIRNPQAVVEEYFARLHRREEAAFDLVAEDFIQHAAAPQGRAGMRQIALVLDHDLGNPDIRIHHVVASGDLVSVHLDLVGTHAASTSPLLSAVPATGKPIVWTFMHLFRVSNGVIAEHWACRDDLGLLVQLGAFPTPNQSSP
ncbi:ester cyclase [Lapillicoccus sp.]|uniref:ester cyclase n=1 Tax=Lapillicoccus sp. TaxID=1909287 RepID=UPI003266012E